MIVGVSIRQNIRDFVRRRLRAYERELRPPLS
jgi:hypothetical protein